MSRVAIRWQPWVTEAAYEIVGLGEVENIGSGIDEDHIGARLHLAQRHIIPIWQRCAHWTGLTLVDRLYYPDCEGWYAPSTDTISVSMSSATGEMRYPHRLRAILHHEIAHAVGCRFPDWEVAVFENLSLVGCGGEHSEAAARVASFYEHHACIADEIGGMNPKIRDFSMIYNGEISNRIKGIITETSFVG